MVSQMLLLGEKMRVILSGAVILASLSIMALSPVFAQSAAAVGGPAEAPPVGFSGQQYVDSRGCVFMRAGFGGQVNWVPRIGRDRRPMCNEVSPSQAAARLAQGDIAAPLGGTQDVGAPMDTIASDITAGRKTGVFAPIAVPGLEQGASAPRAVARTQGTSAPAPRAAIQMPSISSAAPNASYGGGVSGAAACPASAPVLQAIPLTSGGSVTVCTRGDGSATGWVSPNYRGVGAALRGGQGQQSGAALADPVQGGGGHVPTAHANGGQSGRYVQTVIAGQQIIAQRPAPQTYEAAWDDDRLNPYRGLGTATGWSQQAQVWTQKVPAKTHADVARKKAQRSAGLAVQSGSRVTGSSMSAGGQTQATAGGRIYVQVGTFGQTANAQNAAGRLAGLGLPVASAKGTRGGQQLVAIMAGPFASAADASAALSMARSAGFGDAFIR
jgi:hypothetical protein